MFSFLPYFLSSQVNTRFDLKIIATKGFLVFLVLFDITNEILKI